MPIGNITYRVLDEHVRIASSVRSYRRPWYSEIHTPSILEAYCWPIHSANTHMRSSLNSSTMLAKSRNGLRSRTMIIASQLHQNVLSLTALLALMPVYSSTDMQTQLWMHKDFVAANQVLVCHVQPYAIDDRVCPKKKCFSTNSSPPLIL